MKFLKNGFVPCWLGSFPDDLTLRMYLGEEQAIWELEAVNDRTWSALEPIIGHCGEPLPLKVAGSGGRWLLNIVDFVPLGKSTTSDGQQ